MSLPFSHWLPAIVRKKHAVHAGEGDVVLTFCGLKGGNVKYECLDYAQARELRDELDKAIVAIQMAMESKS